MKLLKHVLWLTGILVLFFSCKKEKSLEGASNAGPTQWQFKDSALSFSGRMDTAYHQTAGSIASFVLEGSCNSSSNPGDFYIEIFGSNITVGTY